MITSIILAKLHKKTGEPKYRTAARIFKSASILNYAFKKLDEASIHIDEYDKLGTSVRRGVGTWTKNVSDKILDGVAMNPEVTGGDYIPEGPGY